MFSGATAFNQDIGNWNVGSVTTLYAMFSSAVNFDQDISNWNVSNITTANFMFNNVALSTGNYDALLIGWNSQNLQPDVRLTGGRSQYCNGAVARANMISLDNWTIIDLGIAGPTVNDLADQNQADSYTLPAITGTQLTGAEAYYTEVNGGGTRYAVSDVINFTDFPSYPVTLYIYDGSGTCASEESFELILSTASSNGPFITTWETTVANETITIPTIPAETYNYTVDWGDGSTSTETGNANHTYATPNTYTVSITGEFPRIRFTNNANSQKIMTIEQWGTNPWTSMASAFNGCGNLTGNFTDAPDLSNVTDMSLMFRGCALFNADLDNWDVSNVQDMNSMFMLASSFNGEIGNWNTSNVTEMASMFYNADAFNQDIGYWNTSSLINIERMFHGTQSFSQNINFKPGLGVPFGDAWNTSNVVDMQGVFWNAAAFNQDIGDWNTTNVINMSSMFSNAPAFNQDIRGWDMGNVESMHQMFQDATAFNQDIGSWNLASVLTFQNLFQRASSFNQNISGWVFPNATFTSQMFSEATSFNQDISNWDMSNITSMSNMFNSASSFDQNLGTWNVDNVTNMSDIFANITLSTANYDAILIGWNNQTLQSDVRFNGGNSQYCAGETARTNMITNDGWEISDGGLAGPEIDDLVAQNEVNSFTFPLITGTQLTGSEAYYTETNGSGTRFEAGDIINFADFPSYPVTLYIYDGNGSCSSEQSFQLILTTSTGTVPSSCADLASPLAGDTNVAVDLETISWDAVADAIGYRITINGSTSTVNNITDQNITGTSVALLGDFDNGETVTVTIVPFNADGDAVGCTPQSFNIVSDESTVPECTFLSNPLNGAIDVQITTDITWDVVTSADGYFISVTTESGTIIIPQTDVGLLTSFDLNEDLPFSTTILVALTPYNSNGESVGCSVSQFTTVQEESPNELPDCTAINLPINGATDVAINPEIRWNAVGNIDGYLLNMGTTEGGTDILDNFDVGLTTSFELLEDLPSGQEIFVTVLPYRGTLGAENCSSQSFVTMAEEIEEPDETLYGFSPNGDSINDSWEIVGIERSPNNTVTIYNRWGDMVFQVQGYNNRSNVFNGTANKKTKMGANELPSGTYFFNIEVSGAHNLKKTQGYLVIKR
jgi:gliding motility-associated-like protein